MLYIMSNNVIVLKYGGTSVSSPYRLKDVANHIVSYKKQGYKIAVVVSAMGSTTDYLIKLANDIALNPPKRELDMLLTTGERITMSLLSMAIQRIGYKSISFTGSQVGIITTNDHTNARILEIRGERLIEALNNDYIVIVAGFQGMSREREITTLGRGGSDTTAVALAGFLNAQRCEIITDVNGIYTSDPFIVKNAKVIKEISYDVALQLCYGGAKVMHPRAIALAYKYNIPIKITSLIKEGEGTMIKYRPISEENVVKGISLKSNLYALEIEKNELKEYNGEILFVIEKDNRYLIITTTKSQKVIADDIHIITIVGNGINTDNYILQTVIKTISESIKIMNITVSPINLVIVLKGNEDDVKNTTIKLSSLLNLTEEKE